MIRISQLKLPIAHTEEELRQKIAKSLRLKETNNFTYEILRRSVDARHKQDKKFVYTVNVKTAGEAKIVKKVHDNNIMLTKEAKYRFPALGCVPLKHQPIIAGSGPAGLFCAYYLAKAGYRPIVVERGETAQSRQKKVEQFWKTGKLDPDSNVQFGEGGAGTFSDGKLNTLVKDPAGRNREVLKRFVEAGAPKEILYDHKPHLGTDLLVLLVENLRSQIEAMGGSFLFNTQVTDLIIEENRITAVELNRTKILPADVFIPAIGHSARDTFAMFQKRGVFMEPKSFAVGLRIEHPQKMINQAMYGEESNEVLGAAPYKVTHKLENGRGVYSFCMCPGGYVVNASSEEGMLAVNGMSYQARDGENANSALIVTVSPEDFPEKGPLGGIAYQRNLERAAYTLGGGKIPVQLYGDFCKHQTSTALGEVHPQLKGDWTFANLREILPAYIGDSIEEGVAAFGKKIPGFDRQDGVLSGIESRTSSPVRICRNENLESNITGIYPCGEGAGYAGGITSAAMDGIKTAEAVARRFCPGN
ncbi:MAG: NAD(P)/FAD-dependent oxidoreductase [Blautia sp.]|jgi:uncharacterized FAD-dependent dehydrogenase